MEEKSYVELEIPSDKPVMPVGNTNAMFLYKFLLRQYSTEVRGYYKVKVNDYTEYRYMLISVGMEYAFVRTKFGVIYPLDITVIIDDDIQRLYRKVRAIVKSKKILSKVFEFYTDEIQ